MITPDDEACAVALRTLVDKVMEMRAERAKHGPTGKPAVIKASDAVLKPRDLAQQEELIADPLMEALHIAVREIGRHLFANGGTERMHRVLELAAGADGGRRAGYLDHRWDGIGDWIA